MVCRVCLKESEHILPIFDEGGVEKHISEILQKHLWFRPLPDDPISSVICEVCWFKVNDFHEFYEAVEEAHAVFTESYSLDSVGNSSHQIDHTKELGETLYQMKCEEILNEFLSENDENTHNESNPLYEPEELEHEVKAEDPGTESLDSLNKCKTIKLQEGESASSSESSSDEDVSSDQSEYLPEEFKTPSPISASSMKTRKRSRLSKTSISKTANTKLKLRKVENVSKTATPKKKHEKLCWTKPLYDEMVRKHLPLNCDLCGFAADLFTDLISHFGVSHAGTRPYIRCCGRKINKRTRAVQHAYYHEDPNYFQCAICKRSFKDNYGMRSHMTAQHPTEEELIYQCDQCDKRFARRHLLDMHKPVHIPVEERKFMCTKCPTPKAFASDHFRQIHDNKVHKRTKNVCHVCAKEIRDNQAFEKHVRLHSEDSGARVKCPRPGCDRWLKDEDNLKQHLRRHNYNTTISCEQCGKSMKSRRSLRGHMRYVHSKQIFNCEECQKTFKSALTLKEHMAQHTGETLYNCPFCTRTFNSNANMHSHKKKMHPVEWDIWRKTKTGSSQHVKSNAQVLQTVASNMLHNIEEEI